MIIILLCGIVSRYTSAVWHIPGLCAVHRRLHQQVAVHTIAPKREPHPHGRRILPSQAHVQPRHQCKSSVVLLLLCGISFILHTNHC